jgi:hypothetical protein
MDLIGPAEGGRFLMALRRTSKVSEAILASRRLAMAEIPFGLKEAAYTLGGHHRRRPEPGQALPFEASPSPELGLPLPTGGVRVREVAVESVQEVGSHRLYLTRILHESPARNELRLCHASGLLGEWLGPAAQPNE